MTKLAGVEVAAHIVHAVQQHRAAHALLHRQVDHGGVGAVVPPLGHAAGIGIVFDETGIVDMLFQQLNIQLPGR